jgi:hypothetical protein
LIELHSVPAARAGLQDIELARISHEVTERFYNPLGVGEGTCNASRVSKNGGRANPNRLET